MKKLLKKILIAAILIAIIIFCINVYVKYDSNRYCYKNSKNVPSCKTAIIFGAGIVGEQLNSIGRIRALHRRGGDGPSPQP